MGHYGRLLSGAAAVVVLVVGSAAPAGADPARSMSIDPADDVTTSPVASGTFTGASLLGLATEQISAINLRVSPTGPTGGDAIGQDGCQLATAGDCGTGNVSFTWEIPELTYNGPYVVEATGKYCDIVGLGCGSPGSASVEPITFRLGVEPAAPTDLRLQTGDDRNVEVSWARNGEPDILYYALFRKDPGGDFRRLGSDIRQPASGRPTFTDTSAAATSGGDFAYKVVAVRRGFTGDEKSTKLSTASGERTISVVPPPTTTNPGDPPGGPVTTVAGQGVDIGAFLSGQAPTLPSPGPIFLDLPDTGFGDTLPFGTFPDEAEPGEEDAVLPTTPRQRQVAEFKRNRPLVPVAAGLILLVMAGHVRLLNVRTKAAPEKPPPGTYVARALEAARANQAAARQASMPITLDVAAAVANGHHRAPPDDDLAGLPVWAEFEPALALGFLDAPDDADDADDADADDADHDRYGPPPELDDVPEPALPPLPARSRVGVALAEPEPDVEPERTDWSAAEFDLMPEPARPARSPVVEPEQMDWPDAEHDRGPEQPGPEPARPRRPVAHAEPEPEAEAEAVVEPARMDWSTAELDGEPEPPLPPQPHRARVPVAPAEPERSAEPEMDDDVVPEPARRVRRGRSREPKLVAHAEAEHVVEADGATAGPEMALDMEPAPEPEPAHAPWRSGEPKPEAQGTTLPDFEPERVPDVETFFDPDAMAEVETLFEPERRAKAVPERRATVEPERRAKVEPAPERRAKVEPERVFEPEPEPDRHLLYALFDDEDEVDWAANPEVFVGPRR